MKSSRNLVKKIYSNSPHSFVIEWVDGESTDFTLANLQSMCPCIMCIDEKTARRRLDAPAVDDTLTAHCLYSVGRYALKVDFASGCSRGIYTLDRLRAFAEGRKS